MKVLQIHNFYRTRGGECAVVKAEQKLLEEKGHTVWQFVKDSQDLDRCSLIQKALYAVQIPYNLQTVHQLSRFMKYQKPDVAHVHNVFPLLSPTVFRTLKQYGIPVVQTIHNCRFLCPNGLFYTEGMICEDCLHKGQLSSVKKRCIHGSKALSFLYASSLILAWRAGIFKNSIDQFIALNTFMANKLVQGGVPREKISICGNFIRKQAQKVQTKKPYVLFMGRLSSEKGLETLIKAARNVPSLQLKVAGTGPLEDKLKAMAAELGQGRIQFLGRVTGHKKDQLLQEALCTVIPSEWFENFPMSVVESFASGTPVIGSRIGGLPEMIDHGKTGLLFTPGDVDELSICLRIMMNDHKKVRQMTGRALDTAHERYGPETHYQQLIDIYNESMAGSHQHGEQRIYRRREA